MEHSKLKKELLKDFIAGRISREEMEDQVKMLNGTLIAWKQQDGSYRWRDFAGMEHTGSKADLDEAGKNYSLVLIDDILPDVPPITDESMIPTDI